MIKELLKTRKYKAGYEVREELYDGKEFGCDDFVLKSAYTSSGEYLGDPKMAYRLCKKRGIRPEKSKPDHKVCSIGFCESEQKWYGWSHRAIFGFGVGSVVKKGDCGYQPKDKEDLLDKMINFWLVGSKSELVQGVTDVPDPYGERPGLGVLVHTRYGELGSENWTPYPETWGKGEWKAETLEDAKQMAIDFAEGVS